MIICNHEILPSVCDRGGDWLGSQNHPVLLCVGLVHLEEKTDLWEEGRERGRGKDRERNMGREIQGETV